MLVKGGPDRHHGQCATQCACPCYLCVLTNALAAHNDPRSSRHFYEDNDDSWAIVVEIYEVTEESFRRIPDKLYSDMNIIIEIWRIAITYLIIKINFQNKLSDQFTHNLERKQCLQIWILSLTYIQNGEKCSPWSGAGIFVYSWGNF